MRDIAIPVLHGPVSETCTLTWFFEADEMYLDDAQA